MAHYDLIPVRDDLAKALIAYFTGHLGISTTMRAHAGIGTARASDGVDCADDGDGQLPRTVLWAGWVLYSHESTQVVRACLRPPRRAHREW